MVKKVSGILLANLAEGKMDKQTASQQLAEKREQLRRLFDECVAISDESGVVFETPWGGEGSYEAGLGGRYVPENNTDELRWNDVGWNPSAHSC